MHLKEALGTELDMIELRAPEWDAVVRRGRQVRRRRRFAVGALAASVLVAGSAALLGTDAWVGNRETSTVSAAIRPPGAPTDVVGEGTIRDHAWSLRITRPPTGLECAEGTMDGLPVEATCGTPPQVLVGDPNTGIGHVNFSTGPFGDAYGSVVGVASDQVALVVLRIGDSKAEAVPVDVGAAHRYFAFVFESRDNYTLTAYDTAGNELTHSPAK